LGIYAPALAKSFNNPHPNAPAEQEKARPCQRTRGAPKSERRT
jgi:hypothetical protein